jgi:hypothetical protein
MLIGDLNMSFHVRLAPLQECKERQTGSSKKVGHRGETAAPCAASFGG